MMDAKFLQNILIAVMLTATLSPVSAEVYKWVDKDGKIHYSDQPPIGSDAKKLKRKTPDVPAVAPAAANPAAKPALSTTDQELDYRKRKAEKEEAEKKQLAEAETAKQSKEYCNSLKGELRSHSDGTRLSRYDDKGERVFLNEKERTDSKRNLENRIAKECK